MIPAVDDRPPLFAGLQYSEDCPHRDHVPTATLALLRTRRKLQKPVLLHTLQAIVEGEGGYVVDVPGDGPQYTTFGWLPNVYLTVQAPPDHGAPSAGDTDSTVVSNPRLYVKYVG